jgi:hypothetical protein
MKSPLRVKREASFGGRAIRRSSGKAVSCGEQAQYRGSRDVHYHQFLKPGKYTLNFKLAAELFAQVRKKRRLPAGAGAERG